MTAIACPGRLTLVDDGVLRLRPVRPQHRILARLRARTLDAELARGLPPESDWPRAVRAAMLTAPAARRRLARRWLGLLAPTGRTPAARRESLRQAEPGIRLVAERLAGAAPVAVRPVALARLTLAAGQPTDSPEFLAIATAQIVRDL